MRIGFDRTNGSAPQPRPRSTSSATEGGFAGVLTSVAEEEGDGGPEPELSSATYRLFAAIAAERGDTAHADHFRDRASQAREAGLPLHPSGVLAENGRWDYTPAAALIPETGHFDSRSGQGVLRFTSYGPGDTAAPTENGSGITARQLAVGPGEVDKTTGTARASSQESGERSRITTSRGTVTSPSVSIQEWWVALHREV